MFNQWKITNAQGWPDPVYFSDGQKARAFQANHGGELWHRRASEWALCDSAVRAARGCSCGHPDPYHC